MPAPMRSPALVALPLLALVGCGPDALDGAFTCTARVDVAYADGKRETIEVPGDAVTIRPATRHYQYYEYAVTARGCAATAEGDVSSAAFKGREAGCTLDVPKVGAIPLERISGGVSREPGKRFSKDGVYVQIQSMPTAGRFSSVAYTCHGRPR